MTEARSSGAAALMVAVLTGLGIEADLTGDRGVVRLSGDVVVEAVGDAVDRTALAPLREELSAYTAARSALDVASQ